MVFSITTSLDPNLPTEARKKSLKDEISFSEALEKTKYGIFNYFIIFVSGITSANVLLETTSVAYYMPVAHCDLNLTNTRKGLLSAISYVGIIISSNLWGFLADTKGRRRVIRPTLLLAFVVTLFSSFATNFWTILILRFINGIFLSGSSATIYAYLGEFHIDRTRSRAIMISSVIFSLGAMLMPVISFLVINQDWRLPLPFLGITYKPWRLFIIVCGLPGFIAGLSMFFLPESPKFLLSIHKEPEAIKVLQKIYKINGGKDELKISHLLLEEGSNEVSAIKNKNLNFFLKFLLTMWNQTVPLFRRKYLRTTFIVCTTQFWLYVINHGLYMWFPYIVNAMGEFMRYNSNGSQQLCRIVYTKYENQTAGTSYCRDKLENATFIYSLLMEILYTAVFVLLGVVINRLGKKLILFSSIIFFSSCGLAAIWIPYTPVSAVLYVLLFLVGIGVNVLNCVTVELYPTQLRAMALCVSVMMGRVGGVVGTNIVGAFLANFCELTFYIACFGMMSCAILILFLPKSILDTNTTKKKSTTEES